MNQLRAGNPKMNFCMECQQERPTVKSFIPPDLRRKRRICLFCKKPVEVEPKYHNQPKRCALGKFHLSTLEAAHCDKLHLMQTAGAIYNLRAHPQPRFDLVVNGEEICTYVADFVWDEMRDGVALGVVADSKGARVEVYKIKARLMKAVLGIEILELGREF